MTRLTTCNLMVLCGALLLALAPPALAVDGVVLINQASSSTGLPGCPNGGHFPIVICQSGSYKLSGNLNISDINANGILIAADNVTLDLNGFTISGPVTCTAGHPVPCSGSGSGSGIETALHDNITVRNGTIRGMGSRGIDLDGRGSLIEDVHVFSNAGIGMLVQDGLVTHCTAVLNHFDGIGGSISLMVVSNYLASNGASGVAGGGMISNNLAFDNGENGIVSALYVINNLALDNLGFGIKLLPGGVGYFANQMGGNGFGTVTGGTSMGHNLGNGLVF